MHKYENELMRTLQALAQPADIQKTLFPEFVVVADELVLDFDEAFKEAKIHIGSTWTDSQKEALENLDREIESYSGPNFPEIWLAPDCLSHEAWAKFRTYATWALKAFKWLNQPPQSSDAIYVGPPTNK